MGSKVGIGTNASGDIQKKKCLVKYGLKTYLANYC